VALSHAASGGVDSTWGWLLLDCNVIDAPRSYGRLARRLLSWVYLYRRLRAFLVPIAHWPRRSASLPEAHLIFAALQGPQRAMFF
jgi:hypothetical protein